MLDWTATVDPDNRAPRISVFGQDNPPNTMPPPSVLRTSRPSIGPSELEAVARVLESRYFGCGPETEAFERELQAYLGTDRMVTCVASGTAALQLALVAAGIGPDDEVLLPSLTFVATFQAVAATGARPIACDVRADDGLLDLDDAQSRATPRTRAILPVHFAGHVGNIDAVYALARKRGWRVVEDAAHAFGTRSGEKKIGAIGDIVCLSFDPIKNITAGQGGAVVTADNGVAASVRKRRDLSIESAHERGADDFEVSDLGWRYAMSDIMAAIGRCQLARFETELRPRREMLAAAYRKRLLGVRKVRLLASAEGVTPHIFPIRVDSSKRDSLRAALAENGFETRVHYKPNHLLRAFADGMARPASETLYREILTLPLHHEVDLEHVERITHLIERHLEAADGRR